MKGWCYVERDVASYRQPVQPLVEPEPIVIGSDFSNTSFVLMLPKLLDMVRFEPLEAYLLFSNPAAKRAQGGLVKSSAVCAHKLLCQLDGALSFARHDLVKVVPLLDLRGSGEIGVCDVGQR